MSTNSKQDLLSLIFPADVAKLILNYAPHHPTALILKQVVTRIDEESGHGFLVKFPAPAHARKRNNIFPFRIISRMLMIQDGEVK